MENIDFIKSYFNEEIIESLLFIIIGIISLTLSLFFLFVIKYSFYKGLSYPLLLIGLIQISVGSTVYIRSPKDIIRVENLVKYETKKIKKEEVPRMQNVINNFIIYKWTEIGLIILGGFLFFYLSNSTNPFWKGLGLGLLIQASVMLTLDILAESRAKTYLELLSN